MNIYINIILSFDFPAEERMQIKPVDLRGKNEIIFSKSTYARGKKTQ